MCLAEIAPSGILQVQVGKAQCDRRLDEVQQDLFIFSDCCAGTLVYDSTSLVPFFSKVEAQRTEGTVAPYSSSQSKSSVLLGGSAILKRKKGRFVTLHEVVAIIHGMKFLLGWSCAP